MIHGTFRNIISQLMKEGLAEIAYRTSVTFYTLKGVKFDKTNRISMALDHMGVPYSSALVSVSPSSISSNPVYRIIRDLPLGKRSVHDLHLRFVSPQIHEFTSLSVSNETLGYAYTVNSRSKDILLRIWEINGLLIKVSIHRTNTVSVVIGCSVNPIVLDVNGIIRLTNALSIVEDRLSRIVEGSCLDKDPIVIGDGFNLSSDRYRHPVQILRFLHIMLT